MFVSLKFPVFLIFAINISLTIAQIATNYPNDINIENDPNVIFVEKFDDDLSSVFSRYNEIVNGAGMTLDSDVPPASGSPYSLKITSIQGVNTGGHLYKSFTPGFDSTVFIRYYVQYPAISNGYFHHEGLWFGGYNPVLNWPFPQAGICGLGSSRLSIAYEPVWQGIQPGMDTYLYWGDMRSFDNGNTCYGNTMVSEGRIEFGAPASSDAPLVDLDQWMCVEIMIKLNNPVSAYNGELRIWQDGVEVGHWGPGFPNGHWLKDKWYNNPDDPPFEGFRWRTDSNLNINWIWFEFYHSNPNAPSSYIKFANTVIAREYIGPIYDPSQQIDQAINPPNIRVFPNPSSDQITISGLSSTAEITFYDVLGAIVIRRRTHHFSEDFSVSALHPGIYSVKITEPHFTHIRKVIVQ